MAQTRIDQFYKVTSSSKKPESINVKRSSTVRSPVRGKMKRRQVSDLSTTCCVRKKKEKHTYSWKTSEKQKQDNVSSASETPQRSSKADTYNGPTKVTGNGLVTSPTVDEHASPIRSQQRTPTSHSGAKFTPKTASPIKDALDRSPGRAKTARRKLFKDKTVESISVMINNLNLAKEGAIANTDIDLEKAYSNGSFNYQYTPIDTTVTTRYEINDVVVPTDMYSLHFFQVIVTVFSNPINCGYFTQDELDLIFSLITLQKPAQALFIRMLKRKHTWHRISNIKYDEISNDLKPIFDELVSRSIFQSNTEEEDLSVLLNLLQVDEIRKVCQESKINVSGKKENIIQSVLKFCRKTKSLFPGMATPASKLRALVTRRLGDCILLNTRVKEVVDRTITLLIPSQDPTETLVDLFLMLLRIETDQIKFPEITISDFPIFASKGHLLRYIEAKSTLTNVLSAIEEKQWETVRKLGTLAARQRLPLFMKMESESLQNSNLPHYIRHFMPGYMWLKVLSKSIDAFKKMKETIPLAIEFLRMLINQDCHMKHRKGQWYSELIKIEMFHRKNLEASVAVLSDAMTYESLTEVDRLDLLDRAEKIVKRKSGISQHAKAFVKRMLDNGFRTQLTSSTSITIKGTLCGNASQKKSVWRISNGVDQQTYGSVESLALYYYKCEGYVKGMHCEGAFPITLFATLFWDEIYDMKIPGAWVSLYQDAPLDLYSSEFYKNRKKQIDMKLQMVRKYDSETLSKHLKREFELHCEYKSIAQGNIFNDSSSLQEIAFCLGVEGVVGICERLIYNFPLWKAGFPDIFVWNARTKQYKIVEVKGPGDSLSTKQKLWLDYLIQLGLNTEVCYCESDANSKGRKRKHEETERL
ncbi:fanconi-associated nuclease 1-like [Temnothorax curvispinosus]|uniref:Fanconi-associated nuclease n=1 Tax=Temnothorax curvispinosus TaxID=300111 RepID=A0A6J1PXX7_9HYME|nr:fanconi-associated nuclease 1-like [Temnothorax curvispinosus]